MLVCTDNVPMYVCITITTTVYICKLIIDLCVYKKPTLS